MGLAPAALLSFDGTDLATSHTMQVHCFITIVLTERVIRGEAILEWSKITNFRRKIPLRISQTAL